MVEGGRIPPQNIDAEASLLGSVLIDTEALGRIADKITSDDFYDNRHKLIYEAMISLYNTHKPVDLLTLSNALEEKAVIMLCNLYLQTNMPLKIKKVLERYQTALAEIDYTDKQIEEIMTEVRIYIKNKHKYLR